MQCRSESTHDSTITSNQNLFFFFPVLRWKVYFSITISLENANVHSLLTLHNCYRCSFFFLSSFSSYLLCQSVFNLQKYLFEPSSVWAFVLDEHSKLKWKTVKGAYHHQLPSLSLTHCVLLFFCCCGVLPFAVVVVCYRRTFSPVRFRSYCREPKNRAKENIYDHFAEPYQTIPIERTSTHSTVGILYG